MNAHMEAYQKTLVEIANDLAREEVIVRLAPLVPLLIKRGESHIKECIG